jgi:hypothetical protein
MQYLLLIYLDGEKMYQLPREEAGRIHGAYMAYTEALKEAGAFRANHGLRPATEATTVRVSGEKASVLNGPFAETKEQLAGYFLIEAPDLDAALAWAKRCPGAAYGAVEVRPVWA